MPTHKTVPSEFNQSTAFSLHWPKWTHGYIRVEISVLEITKKTLGKPIPRMTYVRTKANQAPGQFSEANVVHVVVDSNPFLANVNNSCKGRGGGGRWNFHKPTIRRERKVNPFCFMEIKFSEVILKLIKPRERKLSRYSNISRCK